MGKWVIYNRSMDRIVTECWGDFLGSWLWDFFATFTIRGVIKVNGRIIDRRVTLLSAKRFAERYLQENDKDGSCEYFMVVESDGFSTPHIHILIRGVKQLTKWKHGKEDVQPYNPNLGARYYIVKNITSKYVDYDFRLNRPETQTQEL